MTESAAPLARLSPSIAMVAGETSGDLLASLLLGGLQARWPEASAFGIGGPQMQQRGFEAWWSCERLAVHGYSWEVFRRLAEILNIRRQLRQRLLKQPPAVFVGIDAPDFNLGLETDLRAAGIKTVHFVCPSIWAWRADRVEKIRRAADHVLCIFPFEPELLARHGIDATYVGHPLASVIPLQPDRAAARRRLGLPEDGLVLAVLPGSRRSEIRYLAARFFQAAAQRLGTDLVIECLAARSRELLGIVQALDGIEIVKNDSSGHDRASQRAAARFVHARNQPRRMPGQARLFRRQWGQ